MRQGRGIALALAAATLYGNVPVLAKLAYLAGIPAIESITLRTLAVAVILGMASLFFGHSLRIPRQAVPAFLAQSLATLGVSLCYLMSVQFIPVSLAVIIFFTFPVIVIVLSPLIEGHRPSPAVLAVAAAAFLGLGLSVGPSFERLDPRGLALAAGASISCTLQFFSGRRLAAHMPPTAFASLVHAVILPLIVALALGLGHGTFQALARSDVAAGGLAAMLGVSLAYLGGYFLHMSSLAAARASAVVPFFNFEPVVSTVMATAVLGERLAVNQYLGGAIVLASLVVCGLIGARSTTP